LVQRRQRFFDQSSMDRANCYSVIVGHSLSFPENNLSQQGHNIDINSAWAALMAWPVGFNFYHKLSSVFLGNDVGTGSLLARGNLISAFRQILSNSCFNLRLSHFTPSDYLEAEGKRGGIF
jgi:hypothetical protein